MEIYQDQHESVTQKKTTAGWLDAGTPPSGFNINDKICAAISTYLFSAIQENVSNTNFTSNYGLVPLPPVPGPTPPINPIVTTESNSACQYFIIIGTLQETHSDTSSISSVIINGSPYQGQMFHDNGH